MPRFTPKNLSKITLTICLIILGYHESRAQLFPLGSMYFQNQYLANPALAGASKGLQVQGIYKQQWSSVPGSPVTQSLTAEYQLKDKVGLGLNFYNDQAGLLKNTKVAATYAYHLPLNEQGSSLHMGISLGMMMERVVTEDINTDPADPSVGRFNQRERFLDGDFGVAYTSHRFSLQAAVPHLKQILKKDEFESANRPTFYSAVSYRLSFGQDLDKVNITPKVAVRGIAGHDNLIDAGANVSVINDRVNLMGMYHSNRNATFGLGLNYNDLSFLGIFTTETAALRGYAHGNFEVGLRYRFFD